MKSAADTLGRTSHKLAEAMYAKAATDRQDGDPGASAGDGATAGRDSGGQGKDDVVDADFEEVKGG